MEESSVFVTWKRPDGFCHALPQDFRVVEVAGCRLWLHARERDSFPFRVSGGWHEGTCRLNRLVNLLHEPFSVWQKLGADRDIWPPQETLAWLKALLCHLKGDAWEIKVMETVLGELERQVRSYLTH